MKSNGIIERKINGFFFHLKDSFFKRYYINNNIVDNKINHKIRVGGPISRRITRFYYYYIWLGRIDL